MSFIDSYPLSPVSPSSPHELLPLPPPVDERRRSKRDSTASSSRKRDKEREEAASRYPSPPPSSNSSSNNTRKMIETSLQIPPYNPSNRRPAPVPMSDMIIPPYQPQSQASQAQKQLLLQQQLAQSQLKLSQSQSSDRNLPPLPSPSTSNGQRIPPPQVYAQSIPQQQPQQQQQQQHRPVSTTIIPVQPSSSSSTSNKVRQSVGYLPTSASSTISSSLSNPLTSLGPHPQLYTPHQMPRQKIYFGPYILLQTLGEGEFGKVKLGVHSERWGEEVAIKLIKRGNVDTAQRGEKVRREIDVLKAVRHPNIVRLYDVIETEKYIGIVLEYASGGELFDHILAHRYLKERDAARLFAQLISGVAYLHAKHIVHRDLKLENLLLDRNRNVIITDFGFANRFETAEDDLMATSCGSPCYAAPELVVQEGKYVGTAVDVWSCGVILYAMLAGYLPYDDDPANPEGDNINLLYKYIMNTPLTFPEWISGEPRDLLLQMLVPDPQFRCTIEEVTRHSWLSKYTSTFSKSVQELEGQAQDAELWKREALEAQRQFLINQQAQIAQAAAGGMTATQAQAMTRSQSTAATRHRSAIVTSNMPPPPLPQSNHMEYQIPASVPEESISRTTSTRISATTPAYQPISGGSRRNSTLAPTTPTIQTHPISVDADPFSYDSSKRNSIILPSSTPMVSSLSAPPNPPATYGEDQTLAEGNRRGESRRRHAEMLPPTSTNTLNNSTSTSPNTTYVPASPNSRTSRRSSTKTSNSGNSSRDTTAAAIELERRKKSHRATVQVEYDGGSNNKGKEKAQENLPSPVEDDVIMKGESPKDLNDLISFESPRPINTTTMDPLIAPNSTGTSTPPLVPISYPLTPPREEALASPSSGTPRKRKSTGSLKVPSVRDGASTPPPAVPSPDVEISPKTIEKDTPRVIIPNSPGPASLATSSSNGEVKPPTHKKGKSGDRFSIRNLLSGTTSGSNLERSQSQNGRRGSTVTISDKTKSAQAIKEAEVEALAKEKALEEVTNTRRQSRRQKAMSLQPFKPNQSAKLVRTPKLEPGETLASVSSMPRTRSTTAVSTSGMLPPSRSSATIPVNSRLPTSASTTNKFSDVEANWNSTQAGGTPSGKAKAVMDWFRRRSTRGMPIAETPQSNIPTDFDRKSSLLPSIPSFTAISEITPSVPTPISAPMAKAPSVIVTAAVTAEPEQYAIDARGERSAPNSRTASGAQSHLSQMSTATTNSTAATTASNSSSTIHPVPLGQAFTNAKLRTHQGALDKSAITSKSPPNVIVDIRNTLWSMGIDVVQEGDYKLKCVRKSRKKALSSTGMSKSTSQHSNLNVSLPPTPRMNSIPMSSSGMVASPSTSSGFRSFFNRKNSIGSPLPIPTSMTTSPTTMDGFDPNHSPLYNSTSSRFSNTPQPLPTYGESDGAEEVKFYVELTKVGGLEGLYCVDLRRLKGTAWSYKFIYDSLLSNVQLTDSKV